MTTTREVPRLAQKSARNAQRSMMKACIRYYHIEHVEVSCKNCRHGELSQEEIEGLPATITRCGLKMMHKCPEHDYVLWEFHDRNAEVLGIWDEKDEVKE